MRHDGILKTGISLITNTELSETQWLQASLLVKDGGLGVRRATSLALPSFLASASSTSVLQSQILESSNFVSDSSIEKAYRELWSNLYDTPALDTPLSFKQGAWDHPYLLSAKATLLESAAGDAYNSVMGPHVGRQFVMGPHVERQLVMVLHVKRQSVRGGSSSLQVQR